MILFYFMKDYNDKMESLCIYVYIYVLCLDCDKIKGCCLNMYY